MLLKVTITCNIVLDDIFLNSTFLKVNALDVYNI